MDDLTNPPLTPTPDTSSQASPVPQAAAPPRNLAELLQAVLQRRDLSPSCAKKLPADIRACTRIIARNSNMDHAPAQAFPCDVAWLNRNLFRQPPKAHGVTKRTFWSVVSGLRVSLRLTSAMPPERPTGEPQSPAWANLAGGQSEKFARLGVARLASWCDPQGIMPGEVTNATFQAFERYIEVTDLRHDAHEYTGRIAKHWRRLIRANKVAASAEPTVRRRQPYTRKAAEFPLSFQRELDAFCGRLLQRDRRGPYRGDGPPRILRASSVNSRRFHLVQAASALVLLGRPIETIEHLADLVDETAFERILTYYWKHSINLKVERGELPADGDHPAEAGVTTQTASIASALMIVARYHCRLADATIERLAEMASDVTPKPQTELNARTRALLNQLSVPAVRRNLLSLPQTLMDLAVAERDHNRLEAGRLAMIATAVEIEFAIPLRIGNLSILSLDRHLKRLDPRTRMISLLHIPAIDVKNDTDIEWPISPETGGFIERYIRDFRPFLNPGNSSWLFPSAVGDPTRSRSIDAMRYGITGAVAEHVGVRMRVHDFRAFAGMLLLEDSPGAVEDLRILFSHKTLSTSQKFYMYLKPADAARRFEAIVGRARKGISPHAKRSFPTSPKPGRKS